LTTAVSFSFLGLGAEATALFTLTLLGLRRHLQLTLQQSQMELGFFIYDGQNMNGGLNYFLIRVKLSFKDKKNTYIFKLIKNK
jgi:hypothetical protein